MTAVTGRQALAVSALLTAYGIWRLSRRIRDLELLQDAHLIDHNHTDPQPTNRPNPIPERKPEP